jgi:hypothetical protein
LTGKVLLIAVILDTERASMYLRPIKENRMKAIAYFVCALVFVGIGVTAAHADPSIHLNGESCYVDFGPPYGSVTSTNTTDVITQSQNGNINNQCNFILPTGSILPQSTLHLNYNNTGGSSCAIGTLTGLVYTNDWTAELTPGGQAKLSCHYKQ